MKNTFIKFPIIVVLSLFLISCGNDNSTTPVAKSATTSIKTEKETYAKNEPITVNFDNMSGDEHDWIGIYPVGVSSDWGNQLQWTWTKGNIQGQKQFDALPIGDYEVRAFFNNSFDLKASYPFKIDGTYNPKEDVVLTLNKNEYLENELITIQYSNMQGDENDWIGLFPENSENIIDSKQTNGSVIGELSLAGVDVLPDALNKPGGLKAGNYEIRAFFSNASNVEKVASFTVIKKPVTSTVYESADNQISPNWVHVSGPTPPSYDRGMVHLTSSWVNQTTNTSEYKLVFPNPNSTQKVLELDAGGLEYQKHFYIGVILETTQGPRKMIWDPFFSHGNVKAFKTGQYLAYPLYVDIQLESEQRHHVRVDVEKYLKILEPNNKVVSISTFMASGGDLDEIKLSSH